MEPNSIDLNRYDIRFNQGLDSVLSTEEKTFIENKIEIITTHISNAQAVDGEGMIQKRKAIYNSALVELINVAKQKGSLPKALQPKLYELLHRFASDVRYNQDANGFKDSAKLMRLSLNLQCHDLGVQDFTFRLQDCANFDDLMGQFHDEFDIGLFYDRTALESIEKGLKNNPEMREMLGQTLIRLAFSYQNMTPIPDRNRNIAFQTLLDDMTLMVLAQDTLAEIESRSFFMYNRCCFMTGLKHDNPQSNECKLAQIQSYQPIEVLYRDKFGIESPIYKAKLSQIENMRGILTTRMINYSHADALEHFRLAHDIRVQIPTSKDDQNREVQENWSVQEKWDHDFLLNNIRTGLIHELVQTLTLENIIAACEHGQEMQLFVNSNLKEGRKTSYDSSYANALLKVSNLTKMIQMQDQMNKMQQAFFNK